MMASASRDHSLPVGRHAPAQYQVDGPRVLHPDGAVSAVVSTGDLDVEALDPARRSAVVGGFVRLCHTLDSPLQAVVRVRPVQLMPEPPGGPQPEFSRAMGEHWRQRVMRDQPHARKVLLATRAATPAALDASVERLLACTQVMGLAGVRLRDESLHHAVTEAISPTAQLQWSAHPQYATIGSTFVRSFALRRLPGHFVNAGWLAPLLRVQVECDIALHLSPVELGRALHALGRRLRDFSAHRMLDVERGALGDVGIDVALESAVALRSRLARNLGRPLELSLTVTVRAPSLLELQRRCGLVRGALASTMSGAEPTHFRHLSAYLTTLPLARDVLGCGKLVESTAAATCLPWCDAGCCDTGGYRLGAALRSGAPVRVAPFDSGLHSNANIAVFAASGHGKSFALGTIVLEAAAQGVAAAIIDPEGEYGGLVASLSGTYCVLSPGSTTAINVFDAVGDDGEEAVAALTDLVAVMCDGRLSDVQRAAVDAAGRFAQQHAAAERRIALLGDCLEPLRGSSPDVAAVLQRYCSGGLGMLFNRPTSLRLDAGVCAVSLVDMPAEHVAVATLLLARWLWSLIRRDRRRRHVIFDEVGSLCTHAPLRALLVQLARRCRKYGASLVVATQNAQDLLGTDEGRVVATNCAMLLLGGHRPAETTRMQDAFGLTPAQRHYLEAAARGEFLLIAGDRRLEMRIDVPGLHHSVLVP